MTYYFTIIVTYYLTIIVTYYFTIIVTYYFTIIVTYYFTIIVTYDCAGKGESTRITRYTLYLLQEPALIINSCRSSGELCG